MIRKPRVWNFFSWTQTIYVNVWIMYIHYFACININISWQNWWNFAMKTVPMWCDVFFECAVCAFEQTHIMFIYRHWTRTTLFALFSTDTIYRCDSSRNALHRTQHMIKLSLYICERTELIFLKIIPLTHGNRSHYTFLSSTSKLITSHFVTFETGRKLSLFAHGTKWNDFCKSFCIVYAVWDSHIYAYHTGNTMWLWLSNCVLLLECEPW